MSDEVYERGLAIRKATLGEAYVDASLAKANAFTHPFQRLVTEYCWGASWGREAFDLPTRSLLTVTILAATGKWEEFDLHFRGALRNGTPLPQLRDALLHVAVYAGMPAGVSGFARAKAILEEEGVDLSELEE